MLPCLVPRRLLQSLQSADGRLQPPDSRTRRLQHQNTPMPTRPRSWQNVCPARPQAIHLALAISSKTAVYINAFCKEKCFEICSIHERNPRERELVKQQVQRPRGTGKLLCKDVTKPRRHLHRRIREFRMKRPDQTYRTDGAFCAARRRSANRHGKRVWCTYCAQKRAGMSQAKPYGHVEAIIEVTI